VGKITILRKKIIFFPILGGRAPGAPPPESSIDDLQIEAVRLLFVLPLFEAFLNYQSLVDYNHPKVHMRIPT
jgi:hypothetical protein